MSKLITICTLVLCIGSFARAEDEKSHEGPCAHDRQTLCGKIEPGEGRVAKCMMENKEKLSASCKAHREEMHEKRKEAMKEIKEACHADAEKFCGEVEHGHGHIMKCMKDHKAELSATCKKEIEEMKERHHKKGMKGS
ncbi:MAG: cysteine rich repeat-containing protein [Bdellovibrio sp.]